MAWKTRPSGKRYLYVFYWSSDRQRSVTRYIPLADAPAVAAKVEQTAERRRLAREAKAAYRAALAKQREKAKQRKRDRPIDS